MKTSLILYHIYSEKMTGLWNDGYIKHILQKKNQTEVLDKHNGYKYFMYKQSDIGKPINAYENEF